MGPPPGVVMTKMARCRHGTFVFFPNEFYIGRSMDVYGEYSEAEAILLTRILQPNDYAVEAGSHIGTLTVPMAHRIGDGGLMFAFEPQRVLFEVLCTNAVINGLWNIMPYNMAIGERTHTMGVPEINYAEAINFGGLALSETDGVKVGVITIDSLELPHCRLIKADVQGFEQQVLRGAQKTIERCRPFLYVENEDQTDDIPALMRSFGYDTYWHTIPLFNPGNFREHPENIWRSNFVSFNVVGVPVELRDNPNIKIELEPIRGQA